MRYPSMKWIVVDYLTAMDIDDRNYYLQVGQAVKKLRDLAKEIDVFVILVSQLNRKLEDRKDKRPNLADLRDSGILKNSLTLSCFCTAKATTTPASLTATKATG